MLPAVADGGAVSSKIPPDTCKLDGILVLALLLRAEDPCARCNHDRAVCKGRPRADYDHDPRWKEPAA